MHASPYSAAEEGVWDTFVDASVNGTILHTRRFLSYHGSRFLDRSLLVKDGQGRIVGLLPAAQDPEEPGTVVSHPGTTYGGLVHNSAIRGEGVIDALRAIAKTFTDLGYTAFRYKVTPWIYHRHPTCDDLYALFRLGGRRRKCEISAAIDLALPFHPTYRRRRSLKRAAATGVDVSTEWRDIRAFWTVLETTLADRYGATPTHSLSEIQRLRDLFPDEIEVIVGRVDGEIVCGVVLFTAGGALHLQYSAANELARNASAMDAVFVRAIERARDRQCRFFDFGTSNERDGRRLNQTLYEFKLSFGAGSVVQEQYEIPLPLSDSEGGNWRC